MSICTNADKHNIGVTWHKCDVEGCTYKCKQMSNLKSHKAYMHNIDVTWHKCDVEGYLQINTAI